MLPITIGFLKIQFLVDIAVSVLSFFAGIVGNYGMAIVLTTILIRIILLPISLKQERSMAKMKELQPAIDKINKKYKDDKQTANIEIQKLYKEKGVNPLSGCLPFLIQLPIFIALYQAFASSSIPSDAHFLWFYLKDPDRLFTIGKFSFNLLPLLSAALMLLQQKLMIVKNSDSEQNAVTKAMFMMPVFMTFIFYNLSSGLNLYYTVNSALSILQQVYISRKVRLEDEQNSIKSK